MSPPLPTPAAAAPAPGRVPPVATGRRRWPAVDHGGHVLAGYLGAAVACLVAGLALRLGADLAAGSDGWPAALRACGRDLLSWGFVPAAAATAAIWRRCRRPLRPALREQLVLAGALGLVAVAVALGLDCVVHQQLGAYTLGAGLATALGVGLLAPVLAFAVWPR